LSEAVQRVVREGQSLQQVVSDIGVPEWEPGAFKEMLEAELNSSRRITARGIGLPSERHSLGLNAGGLDELGVCD